MKQVSLGRLLRAARWTLTTAVVIAVAVLPGWWWSRQELPSVSLVVVLFVGGLAAAGVFRLAFGADVAARHTAREVRSASVWTYDHVGLPALRVAVRVRADVSARAEGWEIGSDVTLGVPRFDRGVRLRGPEDVLLAALDEPSALALSDVVELYDGKVGGGAAEILFGPRVPPDTARDAVRDLHTVAAALAVEADQVPRRLAELARGGTEPQRRRAIVVLLEHHPAAAGAQAVVDELFAGDEIDLARLAAQTLGRDDLLAQLDARELAARGHLSIASDPDEAGALALVEGAGEGALSEES